MPTWTKSEIKKQWEKEDRKEILLALAGAAILLVSCLTVLH